MDISQNDEINQTLVYEFGINEKLAPYLELPYAHILALVMMIYSNLVTSDRSVEESEALISNFFEKGPISRILV